MKAIDKVSPRPWKIIEHCEEGFLRYHVLDDEAHVVNMYPSHFNTTKENPEQYHTTQHIVHCVNAYDQAPRWLPWDEAPLQTKRGWILYTDGSITRMVPFKGATHYMLIPPDTGGKP